MCIHKSSVGAPLMRLFVLYSFSSTCVGLKGYAHFYQIMAFQKKFSTTSSLWHEIPHVS